MGGLMSKRQALVTMSIAVWLTTVVGGLSLLSKYSLSAGVAGSPSTIWPIESRLARGTDSPHLVMVVHPRCPCSRASIGELATLMAREQGHLQASVVFVEPPGFDGSWAHTDLWASAGLIPGVTRVIDDGREARLFSAATSGQTMVYDADGKLRFTGGITVARGHYGDNEGVESIAMILDDGASAKHSGVANTPVFGCALFDSVHSSASKAACPR
jgi:hypothetical protein